MTLNNKDWTNDLTLAKRSLLEWHLTDKIVSNRKIQTIPKRKSFNNIPLSFSQERLWFINRLYPDSFAYNVITAFKLKGKLDEDALRKAFSVVTDRHEILHTTFIPGNDGLVQRIKKENISELKVIDLSDISIDSRGIQCEEVITQEAKCLFNLEKGPLFSCTLIKLENEEHILLLVNHHIISDAWSMTVFFQEISTCYDAIVKQTSPVLPELPIQYADYSIWQNEWMNSEELQHQLSYWKKQLQGAPPELQLPLDYPRPAVQGFSGAAESIKLPSRLTESLKNISRRENTTLFMTLLATYMVFLFRYTNQEDISVGIPIAGRTKTETETLIGPIINTLVLRISSFSNKTFQELLNKVRQVTLEAYENQNLPFEKLVEELQLERNLSYTPLFQTMFNYRNVPDKSKQMNEITLEPFEIERTTSKFDLMLEISEMDETLFILFEYNTDIFKSETIKRMLCNFQNLLNGVSSNLDERVNLFPILTNKERHKILFEFNETTKEYPVDLCIHQIFEKQAEKKPNSIALMYEDKTMTYKEINERANQLASYLRECGIGTDILVGICMDRSLAMMVGLLAILKAGGAYVPLDPAYPQERLRFMLEDTKAQVLLTEESLLESFTFEGVQVIYMDKVDERISGYSVENLQNLSNSEDLAYVIYTSGSIGVPKGVEVHHCGVVRLLFGVDYVELGPDETFLQLAPVSFDASTFEIWGALLHGARCVLFPEKFPAPKELGDIIKKYEVSTLWLTSSLFNTVIDEVPKGLSTLKQLLIGGETLSVSHVRRALDLLTSVQIINGYGPTENTTFTCCYPIPRQLCNDMTSIPIGRPIGNTEVFILDKNLNPVPIGVYGELYTGGAGMARGYLNQPELTAERFIPNPFNKDPKSRLYKTGDIVRFLPDGNIEFSGRLDSQVKVRGYRIELGEIEVNLCQHEAVKEALVELYNKEDNPCLVAYITLSIPPEEVSSSLRAWLKTRLPEYMLPTSFTVLDKLPLTPNGKIDRKELPEPDFAIQADYAIPQTEAEQKISLIWKNVLQLEKVGIHNNFFEVGGNSLLMGRVHNALQTIFGQSLSMVDLFKYPTIHAIAKSLTQDDIQTSVKNTSEVSDNKDIAIIGMAGRFPGSKDVNTFWQNLRNGVESITFFSDEELLAEGIDPTLLNNADYVKAKGVLDDIELFDATFFGYSPREAEIMDPQQRLFHECAWEAIENAGYNVDSIDGLVGIYAGVGMNSYLLNNLYPNRHLLAESVSDFQLTISNDKDFMPTRISYKLNLKGPSVNVQTACSTSLVAVHLAAQSLLDGKCDMVLAGGVSVAIPQKSGYIYQQNMIASPDGHCRAFDAKAQGTVSGSGVGIVVLKRLEQALADGDCIHAVIKGSAINNDGALKVGYTAPSVDGQAAVIADAMQDIGPETITYIETHGTGTIIGDPIEIAALSQVYQAHTRKKGFCAIGSVKTNVGHLNSAAGITGLIKTVQALKHKMLPPSLHFEHPNPKIDFANSPFFVKNQLTGWESKDTPRRAGVSSFGIGGTNAHLVLEEAPVQSTGNLTVDYRPWQLLLLSAKTESALERATTNLSQHFQQFSTLNLADIAYTLSVGRKRFAHRRMLVCKTIDDALNVLNKNEPARLLTQDQVVEERQVVFMFPGQGSQYVNMTLGLYQHELIFREQVDKCAEILRPYLDFDLREVLYPSSETNEIKQQLDQTAITQPALFVIEYSLAQLWMAWGIQPVAMIGHSIGEYVAACLAGVFSLEDALKLVAIRGRLMQSVPAGAMLSVRQSAAEIQPLLTNDLSLAAHNAPDLCVVSGPTIAIKTLADKFEAQQIECRLLHTSHAFHSSMMGPILAPFCEQLAQVKFNPPKIPYISNLSGTWITATQINNPDYWCQHLRQTVRFSEGIQVLLENTDYAWLEIGPGRALATLARQNNASFVFNSLRPATLQQEDVAFLLTTLGQLWLAGVAIDWDVFYTKEQYRRLPLPTYSFERKRYWIEPIEKNRQTLQQPLQKKLDMANWFYAPVWKQSVPPALVESGDQTLLSWLLFEDNSGLGARLAKELKQAGHSVITVQTGHGFKRLDDDLYLINPGRHDDYGILFNVLGSSGKIPHNIIHLWTITPNRQSESLLERVDKMQESGFYSLLFLAQALGIQGAAKEQFQLTVISNNVQSVTGEEPLCPEKATLLGAVKIIPLEYSYINCRSIDVMLPETNSQNERRLINQLLVEIFTQTSAPSDLIIAYRGPYRWIPGFESTRLVAKTEEKNIRLKVRGVYLITGGLGGMGLALAEHLGKVWKARLILIGRSDFPNKTDWQTWLSNHPEENAISIKIRKIQELEKNGAQVLVMSANVADLERMRTVITLGEKQFGQINGVFHCAGVVDFAGVIERRTSREMTDSILSPKVRGTVVLDSLLKDVELDFFVLCSSIGTIFYQLKMGEVGYCAANDFLDAFSYYKTFGDKTFTVSINWGDWLEVGMSAKAIKRHTTNIPELTEAYAIIKQSSILPSEGIEVFTRILAGTYPRIAVSTQDLTVLIEENNLKIKDLINSRKDRLSKSAHARPELSVAYEKPHNYLEQTLAEIWQQLLGIESIGTHDDFFELGGDSLLAIRLINKIQELLGGVIVHLQAVFEAPTIAQMVIHLEEHYADALHAQLGIAVETQPLASDAITPVKRITSEVVSQIRQKLTVQFPHISTITNITKRSPVVFILSPPRSGSTLLRVMLAGHRKLFAPPELGLLMHNTLGELGADNSDGNNMNRQSLVRTLMQINNCGVNEAMQQLAQYESQNLSVLRFYQILQTSLGNRLLVDKSPVYAFDRRILQRAEQMFEDALYIHLWRHPYGMIRSSEESRSFLFMGELASHFSQREISEALWLISHQNILEFLKDVPATRQCQVKFEQLVTEPQVTLVQLCQFLNIEFMPAMLDIYQDARRRMTDGLYEEGRMMGDPKFHQHKGINSAVATKWQEVYSKDFLCDMTWGLAEQFGYAERVEPVEPNTTSQNGGTGRQPKRKNSHIDSERSLVPPIKLLAEGDPLVLSFAQQRLWFLAQLEGQSATYNISTALRLTGQLDETALQDSLTTIIQRHDSLRLCFPVVEGSATVYLNDVYNPLSVTDLSELSKTEQQRQVTKWIDNHAQTPFDLSTGLLMRLHLLKLGQHEHILLFNIHHIISDGWSMGVLFRELSRLYNAYTQNKAPQLSKLPIQYTDYAAWQRNWLQGEILEQQLAYWIEKLTGVPELLELPTDRSRPAVMRYYGKHLQSTFDQELTRGIKQLSRQNGVTIFMTLLAAFKVLLFRYSGQTDLVVGSPIANRTQYQTENLIGFFVNTLALRSQIKGDQTFLELLKQVRQTALDAYSHQDISFAYLVEQLNPSRSLSHSPLFQVMFAFQNMPDELPELSGLTMSFIESDNTPAKFDLTMFVRETEEGLMVKIEYNTDLFNQDTIKRMLGHYKTLLESIVYIPDSSISNLPILTKGEQDQMFLKWNDTKEDYPEDKCIHQLFETQVEKSPDAFAVIYEDDKLTYRELNERSNQLAHYLRKQGVGPDVLVGICIDRSIEMIVSLLGILKAGGAYIPLEPAYPQERLEHMIDDSKAGILLSEEYLLDYLPETVVKKVYLGRDRDVISRCSTENISNLTNADNLAYIIYTSGSTGDPKGVAIEHKAVVNQLYWRQELLRLDNNDLVLQKTPYSFDVSVWELFMPLMFGSRLLIAKPEGHKDPAYLIKLIQEQEVTTLHFVPSMLQIFLESTGVEKCTSIKCVISSGEVLSFDLQNRFFSSLTAQLYNLYGPTEATVDASFWDCRKNLLQKIVPIGYPISNYKLYILDKHLQPVPIGVSGELFIGGVGLARGYINRTDLTAERFIDNPFFKNNNERLYKTGDMASYLPDGAIKFLGRTDYQVKLRGFRIELGEIEAVLVRYPGVEQVVVMAREDEPGNKLLVVYFVSEKGFEPVTSELRNFLKKQLPEYMIPSFFILLESLPIMPNGKVDRKALPAPDQKRLELDKVFLAPSTPTEIPLAEIWCRLLNLNEVGVNDNFFELGGHSLLATRLISRIGDVFKVEIPIRDVFELPTVAGFAERITTAIQSGLNLQMPPLQPVPRQEKMPLSFAQQRLWFLDQLERDSSFYNMLYSLRLMGALDIPILHRSLNAIVSRHEILRTTFESEDGLPFQVIKSSIEIDLPVADLTKFDGSKRESEFQSMVVEEAQRPFELPEGPLIRCTLLRIDESVQVLLLTMHHIISDGWSMGIFKRELSAFYNGFVTGLTPTFGELPIQYVDFAYWQRQWFKGEVLEGQLSYWKKQLEGAPPLLELPTDRPRPTVQSYRGARESIILSCELSEAIKSLSFRERGTSFMTMLAAFKVLLYRYTGVVDILVGLPFANRKQSEIENLIGFFVNTLVLRSDLSGNPSFREFLHQVRETAMEAHAHQDLPFEKLVEDMQPERSLSYSPLFQVMFAYQNTTSDFFEVSNLTLTPVEVDSKTSKFDLSLFIDETKHGMRVLIEYNTDLFNQDTVRRMLGHFKTLLDSITQDPDNSVSTLPILTKDEKDQLFLEWNDTKTDYPEDKCIHQLFEAQAERTPDAVAVVYEDYKLTYRDLNERSNQLAHYLRKQRVGPDVLVGLYVKRSHMMLVGLLAILKTGGAYVPLDPSLPEERLAFILEDARVQVLATQKILVKAVPEIENESLICLDIEQADIYKESKKSLICRARPDNPAYAIYTSGSTGEPKGVMVPHRAVVNFLTCMLRDPGLTKHDILLAVTTLSFDIAILELFLPLITGARTVIASQEVALDGNLLLKAIKNYDITVMQATPSTWRLLLSAGWNGSKHLKVICGGEAMPRDLMRELVYRNGSVWNMYGPTETTVWSTCICIYNVDDPVLIGRPIGNTKTYVLDKQMQPVPIGVRGELYIGGEGLSLGYINRPDLTADCFVNDPFVDDINAKIYKTGDMVRYRSDGNLEYLNRLDNQVKIRGFRIELGEIETVIRGHDKIGQCIVNIWKKSSDDVRLVAYLVLHSGDDVTIWELRTFLKKKLPDYMLPQYLVKVDLLPLLPSGKVDRNALPLLETSDSDRKPDFIKPQTITEKLLAEIGQDVIGVDKVGVNDNFFELGGHSLLATRVMARTRVAFKIELPLQTFFMSPTIADLSKKIVEAQKVKTNKEESTAVKSLAPIPKRKNISPTVLSFAQKRLWFLDQYEPDSSLYNISMAFRLLGKLNVDALHNAINTMISRHDSLRTTFTTKEGEPVQVVVQTLNLDLPLIDIGSFTEDDRDREAQRLINEEAQKPFDLSSGPLLRTTLLRLKDDEHVFLLTIHHIISDGWSMDVINHELEVLYSAFSSGIQSQLSELPIQYADFAEWQDGWFKDGKLENQINYWKAQLDGAPSTLELPNDYPIPTVQSFKGAVQSMILSTDICEDLKKISRQENVTLFMTMLSAFQILLYRYTGQNDIVVGSPIANRTRIEFAKLIGFFVNTLVLRGDFSGNSTFREYLRQVREVTLDSYGSQDLPFEKLVEELNPERTLSHSPLFQVLFAFQNAPTSSLELSGLSVVHLKYSGETSKFDLSMFVIDTEQEGMKVHIEYSTALFDSATIKRMLGHYHVLLEGIIANTGQRISDLPLLKELERDQLLVKWNNTKNEYPDNLCIHQLFEIQAEKTPDAVSVVYEDIQLTYKELNDRANQLAYYLRECGVGPDIMVGICMERSLEMMVGLLGILKAGGAYVPLDPAYPKERLELMLEDTKALVLLTKKSLLESHLAEGVQVIDMDKVYEKISSYSVDNLPNLSNPEDLAYVIYTSGSTGIPKGVEVPHRGVVRLLFGVDYADLGAEETFLQLAPVSFDASNFEIWGALLHGAKCVLFPERIPTPGDIGDVIKKYGVSVLWLTSSLFNTVIDEEPEALFTIKQLLIGGEALSVTHVRRAIDLLPSTRIINGYGPTENTTFTCCYPVPRKLCNDIISISIGRPIGNTVVYILDTHLNPVPVGVHGELYIGGAGLARGYLNHPELTAEKFIPNPFSKDSKSRLYKTGDIVRYLPDGNIEFLGRKDNQVKIRGFRIELGEIEAMLDQHSVVKQVVVLAREDKPDNKRLVAYIVPENDSKTLTSELRDFLKTKLPEYMIPSVFVPIDSIPLTQRGKIDRKVLPKPEQYYHEEKNNFAEPRNDLEFQLTKILERVLNVQSVGITDNFFELGGHSLLVVRLINEIKKTTGKKLGVKDIFHNPTILQLAESLMREDSSDASSLIVIKPSGSKVPLFWVHDTFLVHYLDQDYPLYVLIHPTQDGKLPLHHSTVEGISTYYVQEIRKVQPEGPYVLGGYCFWAVIALEMARQLIKGGHEVSLLFLVNPSPQCLPIKSSGAASQREDNHFKSRVNRHASNIKHLQNTEKIACMLKKFFSVFKSYKKEFYIGIKIAICKTYLFLGRPVPQSLIRFFVYNIYASKVQKKYHSQVYTGSVVLVQSEQDYGRDQSDWSKLSTHEVKIHVVPEADHVNILREPYRIVWAKWLNMYLRRIEANNTGKEE